MAEAVISRLTPVDLHGLDALAADGIAVFVWRGNAPPTGVAGLVDWRLNGAIAQALARGHFSGDVGEQLLIPAPARLHHLNVFVVGLGPQQEATGPALIAAAKQAQTLAAQAGCRRLALAVPHTPLPLVDCDPTALFLAEANTTNAHIIAKVLTLRVD